MTDKLSFGQYIALPYIGEANAHRLNAHAGFKVVSHRNEAGKISSVTLHFSRWEVLCDRPRHQNNPLASAPLLWTNRSWVILCVPVLVAVAFPVSIAAGLFTHFVGKPLRRRFAWL